MSTQNSASGKTNLSLSYLGTPQITRANSPITNFISNKIPALLAYLAVTRRAHSRNKLAALLWGEMSDADAKNNLRQALANLKKYFEDELTITRDAIEFTGDAFVDSIHFDSALRSASSLDPEPASVILTDSLALYRGDFLEGFHVRDAPEFEDWMLTERARLRELALQALHTLTQFHASRGHFTEAIAFASRLLSFDPWREEAHRQLMLLQARTGQISAALAQYESCKKILEKELGVEPSIETTSLYDRIRSARQTSRHNIPTSSTAFVGRESELEKLRQRLSDPACRLVTLAGLGGAGKTRLAQEVARSCADMFINGAWMVQLAAVDSDGLVPAIGNVFDFPFTKGDAKKQLLNFLRQKELLLVMDNFEHLLESSPLVSDILEAAHEVKILVTSRERLDLHGEWVVELPGLAVNSMEANQLFFQSAKRARAEIQVGEEKQAAVSDICRLVGGLPLGIEIAAAWIRSMTVEAIRDEIQKNLDFLESSRRDIPERQRSLRAVFESSWARLGEEEQKAFAALSVFRGGFTREAAEQVAGGFDSLVDKSLVGRKDSRFELHEVTRQFAEEKLSAKKKARNAHAAYFAKWASERAKWNERASFAVMRDDFENVRAAWIWAGEQKDATALSGLVNFTKRYLDIQGRYREGHDLMERALSRFGAIDSVSNLPTDEHGRTIAKLILYRALFLADMGKPDEVVPTLEECLSYFRGVGDKPQIMACLNALGIASRFLGAEDKGEHYFRSQLELARELGNRHEEATALNNISTALTTLGKNEESERVLRECLDLRRELNDEAGVSSTLINLSVTLFNQGRYEEEKPLLQESIEISRRINQPRNLAGALGNLGTILLKEKNYAGALELFLQGLETHRNTGYRYGIAIALDNVGTAQYHLGNEAEALFHLKQSIREARDIKADFIALDALVWVAGIHARRGEMEKAVEIWGMIRNHPKTDPETIQSLEALVSEIFEGIPPDAFKRDEEQGKSLDLGDVLEEIL
ncbi:MAG: tetratricopeptide repeat protein [Anaerolineales bacterium]|nr:tetratricopeptide repeat protein [Anaerolineales bacterium]